MNENVKMHVGSSLEWQINGAAMSDSERQSALAALEVAEALVDAGAWVARKLAEVGGYLFLKPGVKH